SHWLNDIRSKIRFKRLLLYARLLILILAFVTLILDAIILSFEINVMDLELSQCAQQAALLLTPDLLSMTMILILLLYPSASCCCFGPTHSDQDLDQDQEQEHSYLEHDLEEGQGSEGTLYPQNDHYQHQQREGDAEKQAFQHSGTQQPIDDTQNTATTTPVATATNTTTVLARAQDEKDQKRKRRNLRLYIVIRVVFSLGLTVLILYWPASGLRPPVGYLPNFTDVHRAPGVKRVPNSRAANAQSSNTQPGGPGVGGYEDDWCSLAEAFGDNQSAEVYCRVNAIRPAIAYTWASLIVLELLLAFMALDFSSRKWNKNKNKSRQHWEGVEVSGFGAEAEQQQQYEQQSRQQDAIENIYHHHHQQQQQAILEDGAGVGYGGVASSDSPRGRPVYSNG
ncbi:hypothetical protein BGZ51_004437, partial [Haplosporangium sp. Z 767]